MTTSRPGEAEPVRQALIDFLAAGQARLRERFERAKAEGDLPEAAMTVQAKAGFTCEMLEDVAEQALSAWPASASAPAKT